MKKSFPFILVAIIVAVVSCQKDYSTENNQGAGDGLIVGIDCRISKIAFHDSASGVAIGSIAANINATDQVTNITRFDSIGATLLFTANPVYSNDTVFINTNEYFVVNNLNKRVTKLHGLLDPVDPLSPKFIASYFYDASGYLTSKSYAFASAPAVPYYLVNYTYSNNDLTGMTGTDLTTGNLIVDANLDYHPNILPKNYIYIFPDEVAYAPFNQFFNFGKKSFRAVKNMKVRNFTANVPSDSSVSVFNNYIMSRDNYVLRVIMEGNDQSSIPAAGDAKLSFSYKCK